MSILVGATSACAGAAGSGGAAADLGDTIEQSLRFGSGRRLNKDDFSQNHGENATISFWFKRGTLGTLQTLGCQDNGQHNLFARFTTDDQLVVLTHGGSNGFTSTQRFRDPTAWYHFVLTDEKCWINGSVIATGTWMDGQESHSRFNIGLYGANLSQHFDGYMADFYFVDETNMDADDFGRYNDDGVWVPKTPTISSYGNNGFHLTFDSTQTNGIGHDSSGNNNHFTASGFDTSAITSSNESNDIDLNDTPTTLYPTYNRVAMHSSQTTSQSNLQTSASSYTYAPATIAIPADNGKKFYWEVTIRNNAGNETMGMCDPTQRVGQNPLYGWVWCPPLEDIESDQGNISDLVDTSVSTINTGNGTTYMFAYDSDQNVWIGDSGTWYKRDGAAGVGDPGAGSNPFLTVSDGCIVDGNTYAPCTAGSSAGTTAYEWNFGQHAFQYTVPTGFEHLNSGNLPEPAIKDGRDYFGITKYDGTGSAKTLSVNFKPDFTWFKCRGAGNNHLWIDCVRGGASGLSSSAKAAADASAQYITSWGTGSSINIGTDTDLNDTSQGHVLWYWKAGGHPAAENTATSGAMTANSVSLDDALQSSYTPAGSPTKYPIKMSINTTAKFSIIMYKGTGSNLTLPHGLGVKPDWIVIKNMVRSSTEWNVFHTGLATKNPTHDVIYLNLVNSQNHGNSNVYRQDPDTNVFSLGTAGDVNTNNETYIAYVWASCDGFSRMGKYVGNGSADGSFVYTGFHPRWVMVKRGDSNDDWNIFDSARSDITNGNPRNEILYANSSAQEVPNDSNSVMDFCANGFKFRSGDGQVNANGGEYIYVAFGDQPFVGENVPPATAL